MSEREPGSFIACLNAFKASSYLPSCIILNPNTSPSRNVLGFIGDEEDDSCAPPPAPAADADDDARHVADDDIRGDRCDVDVGWINLGVGVVKALEVLEMVPKIRRRRIVGMGRDS
eukprot:CAMPEP_0201660216 /NCGR_PEP_ID=MMETSP0494-20130426/2897_1 /ASSEMBLY_ACC=CAM_ASM_000839 /TAXON_ID=420259 /ORGANISM="Thalassiosira gravida, Strain GMp14c1" /LENGTH=115 /DNA_ID=CAMNT_0048137995 /DNA_START=565 /DNA_END=909 /DNA_ORIENTATION=-